MAGDSGNKLIVHGGCAARLCCARTKVLEIGVVLNKLSPPNRHGPTAENYAISFHSHLHDTTASGGLKSRQFGLPQALRPIWAEATVGGASGRVWVLSGTIDITVGKQRHRLR